MKDQIADQPEQIEILYGPHKGTYNVHPVAALFPLLQGDAYKELMDSIHDIGQQEPVVLDGSDLLDGRNRVSATNDLGIEPLIVQFADLKTGLNQGVWIAAKNLERRHLTNDQYLAISARYFDWCKEQPQCSDEGSIETPEKQGGAPETSASSADVEGLPPDEYPQKPADNAKSRKRGRPRGQRSKAETLARETKQSRYRAEQMLKIRAYSPELAVAVEEGRMTLKDAAAQIPKNVRDLNHTESDTISKKADRPSDAARVERAAVRAIKDSRAIAKRLRKNEQPSFWNQIALCAQAILRSEFPESNASLVENTNLPTSPALETE